jgi:hypothetical protein
LTILKVHQNKRKAPDTPEGSGLDGWVNRLKDGGTGFEKEVALLVTIVGCSLPFAIIDSKPFKDWMTVLGVSMPSEGTIKKLLPPLYESVLKEQEHFVRICGFFSITFDMWTSIAKQKYLVTTYHTMDDDFNLFSAPLDLIPMSCSAYGEFIALAIQARIDGHRFDECAFMASFSDSGSNCELAKGLLTPGEEEPCFHHKLKLMLDDVIGGAEGGHPVNAAAALDLSALGLLVGIVRASLNLRKELAVAAGKVEIDSLELIAVNITGWEGRCSALKRFLELQAALVKVQSKGTFAPFIEKSKNRFPKDFLQPSFFQRWSSYKGLLERFHKISKAGQSQTEPTLSCVPHWVWSMEEDLKGNDADSPVMENLKADLLVSWEKRMSVFVEIQTDGDGDVTVMPNAIKAGILDPRHSLEVQKWLSPSELVAVRDGIISDTLLLCQNENLHVAIKSAMKGVFDVLLERLRDAARYAGPCLSWWRDLKSKSTDDAAVFNHFFRVARIFLSMPAGGTPSESVFSSTTDMVTKKRNALGDDTLEQMTIVRHFVRSPQYNFCQHCHKDGGGRETSEKGGGKARAGGAGGGDGRGASGRI